MTPTTITCARVRAELGAFVDGELRGPDVLLVSRHLESCDGCEREVEDIRDLGKSLRVAADTRRTPPDGLAGLADGVISRVRAEKAQSWTAWLRGGLDDSLWLLVSTGSVAGTLLSVLLVCTLLQVGIPERGDSLAAWISVLSQPVGSDVNPVFLDYDARPNYVIDAQGFRRDKQLPSLQTAGFPAELTKDDMTGAEAVVDREGRVTSFRMLTPQSDVNAAALQAGLKDVRFAPGNDAYGPVAMRVLWVMMHAHVTMRGKSTLE